MEELIFTALGLACVVVVPVAIVAIVALVRTFRIDELERRISKLQAERTPQASPPQSVATTTGITEPPAVTAEIVAEAIAPPTAAVAALPLAGPRAAAAGTALELAIGGKVLGWVAAVLVIFGTAFFLKYAYDNGWIGPLGQVSLVLCFGLALIVAGRRYERHGWRRFSQMLTGAGVVVLYLSTYSAFGFYRLLPQQAAGGFLLVIVVESVLLALLYDAPALALLSVVGSLLTPLLMHSERDNYQALFIYLALVNLGVGLLLVARGWVAIGTVALLGTHGLYWLWHGENFHPEKLRWAIGFQAFIAALFIGQVVLVHIRRDRRAAIEDLVRLLLTASLWFAAAYALLHPDYGAWMGSFTLAMAGIYTALAWLTLARPGGDTRLVLMLLAISMGHVAMALPIEADARFVALGWAAQGAALWWFGLRVRAWPLLAMAAVLAVLAAGRVVFHDTPYFIREAFVPVFNAYAFPSLGVGACVIGSVVLGRRFGARLPEAQRGLLSIAGVLGVVLVWWVLSVDTYSYFVARGALREADMMRWQWAGQMALSALWAVFASILLALGFRLGRPQLRWMALVLYAVTVVKVFVVDMGQLREFYRILAFFILAVLLGAAAWAYQRRQAANQSTAGGEIL